MTRIAFARNRRDGIESSHAHLSDFRRGVGVVWATIQTARGYWKQDNHGVMGSATVVVEGGGTQNAKNE